MNHAEVFIIPAMMLADYFLTVWGAILSEAKYKQHFKFEHYELNPLWQKAVAARKWFNPKHLSIVVFVTLFCAFWSSIWSSPDILLEGVFGYVTVLLGSILATHVGNILTFSYMKRHPESISGELRMNHPLMLYLSQFRTVGLLLVLMLIAVLSPTPFVIGGLCSQIVFLITKQIWIAKANAAERKRITLSNS